MKKQEKTTAIIGLIVIIAICLVLIAVAISFILGNGGFGASEKDPPETAAFSYLSQLNNYAVFTDGERLYIEDQPTTDDGIRIYNLFRNSMTINFGESIIEKKNAQVGVELTCPDINRVADILHEKVDAYLTEKAKAARSPGEIYDDGTSFKTELVDEAYINALDNYNEQFPTMTVASKLLMSYHDGWNVQNTANIDNSLDTIAVSFKEKVCSNLTYCPVTYTLEETALRGTTPDPNGWGETTDPAEVSAMLERPEAKRLVGEQKLVWNPDIEFLAGRKIRYYLDDSILMIQWQQTEARTIGTYSEVIIADGSQLRRKIAGDTFGDMNFETTSDFAKDTNAILALGGDFYNHARNCGICVYNRDIYRFDPTSCDDCYINPEGDMIFSYRGQFSTVEEAKAFVDENNILYSICFGPVLIDNYVEKLPDTYAWGEINDYYARSCLGMLGDKHYISLNMNCELPNHWFLATLRDALNAMVRCGCIKAYTLDGGQTATTAVNGQLINPVQFGVEKPISDIIYFCSAVPRD